MGKVQLQKRLTNYQVKDILGKYVRGEIQAKQAYRYLALGRTRFYQLVTKYQTNPLTFNVAYRRHTANNRLNARVKANILVELKVEKEQIIDNPNVPTKHYNYSYVKELVRDKYKKTASLSTIIKVAKDNNFYKPKRKRAKVHDRQVLTRFVGELVQHDSSHHLFAPDATHKWYLITSIDDYSRKLLFANLFTIETTWVHIKAVEEICVTYGIPFAYYSDQHRIFRFVKKRDKNTIWTTYTKFTDDVDTQWKTVLKELSIQPIYALSLEAKGKVERPYRWLQDHLVRTCVRYGIADINRARQILFEEVDAYNTRRVHSTTGEIPNIRFNKAVKEGLTLFRPFEIPKPYISTKDIFALRTKRTTDGYRNISLWGTTLKIPHALCYESIDVRMCPDMEKSMVELRFWSEGKLLDTQIVNANIVPIVRF